MTWSFTLSNIWWLCESLAIAVHVAGEVISHETLIGDDLKRCCKRQECGEHNRFMGYYDVTKTKTHRWLDGVIQNLSKFDHQICTANFQGNILHVPCCIPHDCTDNWNCQRKMNQRPCWRKIQGIASKTKISHQCYGFEAVKFGPMAWMKPA